MVAAHVYSFGGGAEGTNVTAHTFTIPTGQNIQAGDTLIVSASLASSGTLTNSTLGTAAIIGSGSGRGHHVWVYTIAAGDIGTTFTLTSSTTLKVAVACSIFRGLKGTLSVAPTNTNTATTSTTLTAPAGSPAAGRIILHCLAQQTGSVAPPTTWTPPTGMTLRSSQGTGGTTGRAGTAIGSDLTENDTPGTAWTTDSASSWSASTLTMDVTPAASTPTGSGGGSTYVTGAGSGSTTEPEDVLFAGPVSFSTSSTKTLAGALIQPTDARIRLRGGDGWSYGASPNQAFYAPASRYPRTWGYPRSYGMSFRYTGQRFEVYFLYVGGYGYFRISVNGQRATDLPVQASGSNGNGYYYKVDLGQSVTNALITFEGYGAPLGGVVADTGATLTAAPAYTRPPLVVQGDSQTDGSGYNTAGPVGTWVARLARYRGWENPYNVSIGGTGFVEPGTAVNFLDRMVDVTSPAAGLGIVFGGGNDGNTSIDTAARSYVDQWRAAHPGIPLVIFGTFGPTFPASSARTARDAELEQVAIDKSCAFVSTITGRVRNASGTLLATRPPFITSASQQALYINSTDNVHPTDAGHRALARYLDQSMDMVAAEPGFGSGSGATSSAGSGAGYRAPVGSGSGSTASLGAGSGLRTPKGSGAGSTASSGAGSGVRTPKGSGSGSTTTLGAGSGRRAPVGSGAGSTLSSGTGSGIAPVVGAKYGSGSGSTLTVGAGAGRRTPVGSGSGSTTSQGAGSGLRPIVVVKTGLGAGSTTTLGFGAGLRHPVGVGAGSTISASAGSGLRVPVGAGSGSTTTTGAGAGGSFTTVRNYVLSGSIAGHVYSGRVG